MHRAAHWPKRSIALFSIAMCLSVSAGSADQSVAPQRNWLRMQTANFTLLGNSSDKDLRRVGQRLEQFREAIGILFPKAVVNSPRPTIVLVFKNQKAYDPFKPLYQGKTKPISGYFIRGAAANYISLTSEGLDDFGTIYHEYMHQVVDNTMESSPPLWFNEGLAEYYTSFSVTADGQRASLGKVLSWHILLLREQWVPLSTILAVTHDSPMYNEKDRMGVFYAESWVLVHYLLLGEHQKYAPHAAEFLGLLSDGVSPGDATTKALHVSLQALEKGIRAYVSQELFPLQTVSFTERIGAVDRLPVTPAAEADVHAALGELLATMQRDEEGRAQLDAALALDPESPTAHMALGRMLLASHKADEAKAHLKKAVVQADAPWAVHWDYALLQIQARLADQAAVDDSAIEAALRRVIAANPSFGDAYGQLAWLRAQSPEHLKEAAALARKALEFVPGNEEYQLLLATILMNQQDFPAAHQVLDRLVKVATKPGVREPAATMLAAAQKYESQPAQPAPDTPATTSSARGAGVIPVFRELKAGEERVAGWLTAIECGPKGVVLVARVGDKSVRVHAARFEAVDFITYRNDLAGSINCGRRSPEDVVVVTYRPGGSGVLGEAVAVEFPPANFVPK
jgi:tetratricopeptide (TPR) repeat protein